MIKIKKSVILAVSILMMPIAALSQAVTFLNISPDAATQAMGGASVASEANAFAIYNNPAAIALSEDKFAIGASYNMWQSAAETTNNLVTISTFLKTGDKFGIAAAYRSFEKPSYQVYDANGNDKGDYTPKDMALDLGFSYAVIENLSIGLSFKYISSALSDSATGSCMSADLGAAYIFNRATIAASYTNMFGTMTYDEVGYSLPTAFKVGASYSLAESAQHSCKVNLQANYLTEESALGIAVGGEYGFKEAVFVRLGYYNSCDETVASSYLSAGLGVEFAKISLDCSYLVGGDSSPVAGSMNFALGYRF